MQILKYFIYLDEQLTQLVAKGNHLYCSNNGIREPKFYKLSPDLLILRYSVIVAIAILFSIAINAQTKPELVMPIGHTSSIIGARFSQDDKTLLTLSEEKTAKLWEVNSGKLIKTIENVVGWSNEKYIATFNDNVLKLFDLGMNETVFNLNYLSSKTQCLTSDSLDLHELQFDENEKYLAIRYKGYINIYNVVTNELIFREDARCFSFNNIINFSKHGDKAIITFEDKIKIINTKNGKIIFEKKYDPRFALFEPIIFNKYAVISVYNDNYRLSTVDVININNPGNDTQKTFENIKLKGNVYTNKSKDDAFFYLADKNLIRIYSTKSLKEIGSIDNNKKKLKRIEFSNDSKKLLIFQEGPWLNDFTTLVFDLHKENIIFITNVNENKITNHENIVYSMFCGNSDLIIQNPNSQVFKKSIIDKFDKLVTVKAQDLKFIKSSNIGMKVFISDINGDSIINLEKNIKIPIRHLNSGIINYNSTTLLFSDLDHSYLLDISNTKLKEKFSFDISINGSNNTEIILLEKKRNEDYRFVDSVYVYNSILKTFIDSFSFNNNYIQSLDNKYIAYVKDEFIETAKFKNPEFGKTNKLAKQKKLYIREINGDMIFNTILPNNQANYQFNFSQNSNYFFFGGNPGKYSCQVVDLQKKEVIFNNTYAAVINQNVLKPYKKYSLFNISKGEKYLLNASNNIVVTLRKLENQKDSINFRGLSGIINNNETEVAIESGAILYAGLLLNKGSHTNIYNLESQELKFKVEGQPLIYCDDDSMLVTSISDKHYTVWSMDNGQKIMDIEGHTNTVYNIEFLENNKIIRTFGIDNRIIYWDLVNKKKLFTMLVFGPENWLVHDDDYHYDGSAIALSKLYFSCGTEIIELDQLKEELYVPNLVERMMKGETIENKKLTDLDICELMPKVEEIEDSDTNYIKYKIIPRRGGLGKIEISVNDKGVVQTLTKEGLSKKSDYYELKMSKREFQDKDIFLPGENNTIKVKAYSAENKLSSRGSIRVDKDSRPKLPPPNIYAIFIGVNNYKGDGLDLLYASKDAQSLSSTFTQAFHKLFNSHATTNNVFTYNLCDLDCEEGTPEKRKIERIIREEGAKTKPNDIVFIFFAGHGKAGIGEDKNYYFLTADASPLLAENNLPSVSISTSELREMISVEKVKAQKLVFVYDACQSGQLIESFFRNEIDENGRKILEFDKMNDKVGMYILTSSASNQASLETSKYGHGLLTYAILRTLKENTNINNENGYLSVNKWFDESIKTLEDIARKDNIQQRPDKRTGSDFSIGIVDDEVRSGINLGEVKLRIGRCSFNNGKFSRSLEEMIKSKCDSPNSDCLFNINFEGSDVYFIEGSYVERGGQISCSVEIRKGNEKLFQKDYNQRDQQGLIDVIKADFWLLNLNKK
ncbi:MAG TPA: caspase family protein [Saprospiraceae bacterium]|nr:caspase family protein [Saprospiraceae bacterium]